MKMVLVGPHAGKSIRLGGFVFEDGVADVPHNAETAVGILGNFYSAYPEGSKALEEAQAAWDKTHPALPPLTDADRYIPGQAEYVKAGYTAENYATFVAGREADIRARGGEPIFGKDEPTQTQPTAPAPQAPKGKAK
jgi:hypothetical protein